ncbi:hypothetical protein QYE76_063183 [Lolium multiflorum]|uniref:Uncharacterized protein n=1 Tax=Lolium multiflorum TaxID=4521 RepID=A0AAD8W6S8_LOLMU|nr:hypothetical protein QYE76_063183 [Lolium multiflorum]
MRELGPVQASKKKTLVRPAVAGVAATRAAEAKKKAAEKKGAPSDLGGAGSAPEEPVTASQAEKVSARHAEPTAEVFPLPSMVRGGMASAAMGPDVVPPVVEEGSADVGSTEGQKAPEAEESIVGEGDLSEPLKERRSKAARDRAPPSDADTRAGEVPSTEAVMQAGEAAESRHPPPSTLTFTELHTALGEAHVAEVKRLTALVEEAAQKNRKLIALGRRASHTEKTNFEAFVREMSRQILVSFGGQSPSMSSRVRGASPRAWRVGFGGQSPSMASRLRGLVPEHGEYMRLRGDGDSAGMPVDCDRAYHCLCGGDIGCAPVPESAGGDSAGHAVRLRAVSNIPAVVDWLRRSSCRVGITMALSMVLAHYSEGFDVEEVTAGFP